ncbi:MAG: ATP-binding protein [Prevotella sp.]|nr:ATP-binding protein [Prevotella sp.]
MPKKIEMKVVKKTKIEQPMTLLKAIERIVEISKKSKLTALAKAKMADETRYLAERFGITERQAILFCICMENGPRRVSFDELARHLDVNNIRILSYAEDIDALVRRRLLRYHDAKEEDRFDIPTPVIKALKHNKVYELPKRTDLDGFGLFEEIGHLFDDLNDDAITPQSLYDELMALFAENPQVAFVQKMKDENIGVNEDWLLLVLFCHLLVNRDDDDIHFRDMDVVFERTCDFNFAKSEIRHGTHILIKNGFIENVCEDGIASPTRFKLTDKAKRNLLSELKLNFTEENLANVIKAKEIKAKEMFYVSDNARQVEELHSFLTPEKYKEISERMKQTGFRTSFTCLFYGGPGTGKTETAYQLARQTGRDIMMVDVPQIKSKWVGDSEKNIKALFDRYRELVKRAEQAPILLFNEADAIIGIRKQGASNAVDKMENSIQNIILQEMETLDGIMVATTNLTQNLDSAFERRFLYKIKFEKPDTTVRQRIWQTMMPALSEADAHTLANGYDFSGGQIENISRKATINAILHGDNANTIDRLTEYCNAERLDSQIRKIGF